MKTRLLIIIVAITIGVIITSTVGTMEYQSTYNQNCNSDGGKVVGFLKCIYINEDFDEPKTASDCRMMFGKGTTEMYDCLEKIEKVVADAKGDPVIVAVGDIACSNDSNHRDILDRCHELQTSDLALSVNPDAVFLLGDLQYFDGKYEDFLGSYDPTWGRMKSISYPSPGNHDYQSFDGARGYFDYFGAAAGDPTKGYYSFDIGSWHIISLNSNCQEEDPEDPTKDKMVSCAKPTEQVEWLKNDLAADDSKCTLAFWHHPMFSSGGGGSHPTVGPFWDELYADKADVILVGHDHNYERFFPQDPNSIHVADGITQFVVGTGGWSLWNTYDEKENTAIFNATSYGILKLVLHDSSFDWEFIPEPGSQFTDKGTGLCN